MGKPALTKSQIVRLVTLRETGHSLPEIVRLSKHSNATVFKYIRNVRVLPQYSETLRQKQGGSKERARKGWQEARNNAEHILLPLKNRDLLCLLLGLYWGEGTKKELSVINSDPRMIAIFVRGFRLLGIFPAKLTVSLRLFPGMNESHIKQFWAKVIGIKSHQIRQIYYIKSGKDKRRLEHGMCRLRVVQSARYFKLLMSLLDVFIENYCPRSSMDRTAAS